MNPQPKLIFPAPIAPTHQRRLIVIAQSNHVQPPYAAPPTTQTLHVRAPIVYKPPTHSVLEVFQNH